MADPTKDFKSKPSLDEVKKELAEKRARLTDLRVPYTRAAAFLDQWVQRNFRGEGDKFGGWQPFAASTLKRMDPKRSPAKLLQDTGRLRLSFFPFAHKEDAGIGSALPYAKFHQEGGGNLPARPMLPKSSLVAGDVRRIFKDYTTEIITK